jgi:GT2 family glycosyltransferase
MLGSPVKVVQQTISVVIPTYRRPEEILHCLQALETQSRLPEQVIVTVRPDDTATLECLDSFKEQSNLPLTITLIEEPGVVNALNAGLRVVNGTIVCFTDDDARPHPDWLERIVTYYTDPRVGGVGGRDMVYKNGTLESGLVTKVGTLNWFGRRYGNHHLELKGRTPVEVVTLKGVNSSYRRELIRDFDRLLLGVTQVAYEDDIGLAILKQGYRLIYDPQILVDHYPSSKRPEARVANMYLDKTQIYNINHNYTYVLLKHLPLWRKVSFLMYNFVIGDIPNYGLIRTLYHILETRSFKYLKLLPVAYSGKLGGIGTYRKYRSNLKKLKAGPAKMINKKT